MPAPPTAPSPTGHHWPHSRPTPLCSRHRAGRPTSTGCGRSSGRATALLVASRSDLWPGLRGTTSTGRCLPWLATTTCCCGSRRSGRSPIVLSRGLVSRPRSGPSPRVASRPCSRSSRSSAGPPRARLSSRRSRPRSPTRRGPLPASVSSRLRRLPTTPALPRSSPGCSAHATSPRSCVPRQRAGSRRGPSRSCSTICGVRAPTVGPSCDLPAPARSWRSAPPGRARPLPCSPQQRAARGSRLIGFSPRSSAVARRLRPRRGPGSGSRRSSCRAGSTADCRARVRETVAGSRRYSSISAGRSARSPRSPAWSRSRGLSRSPKRAGVTPG